jgi:Ca2+-binding RTX toxin-like protein
MAELDADFDRPLRMSAVPVGALAGAESSFADDTGVVLTAGDLELDVLGEGLGYDDDGGLVDGTITDVDVYRDEELWFSLTGAEAPVPDVLAAVEDADALAFFEAFLTGDDEILGSIGADELRGFAGDDVLDGNEGADLLAGGEGDDLYLVDDPRDRVVELPSQGTDTVESALNFTLPDHVEELILTGAGDLTGTGNALANRIVGNEGDNRLDGRGGADELVGGGGDDTYLVDDEGDQIVEEPDLGTDTVLSTVSFELPDQVEKLVLVGRDAIDGFGNELDNEITGNDRANLLGGGGGVDTLRGGKGNDIYLIDGPADIVVEERNGGIDTISFDGSIELESFEHVENADLQGDGDHGAVGNALANRLTGNDGDNLLAGLLGNDELLGGAGDDELGGGAGNDRLEGGAGDDRLRGGAGRDRLTGGAGADEFVVGDAARSVATITDFSKAAGDRLLIGELLAGLPDGSDLTPYLSLRARGSAVEVSVDVDGTGRARPVLVAVVQGDLGTDLASLLADGVIDRL